MNLRTNLRTNPRTNMNVYARKNQKNELKTA